MISLFKALIPGAILTAVVSALIGHDGSTGGFLNIFETTIQGQNVHWSWPLFLASTGLAWGIFIMME